MPNGGPLPKEYFAMLCLPSLGNVPWRTGREQLLPILASRPVPGSFWADAPGSTHTKKVTIGVKVDSKEEVCCHWAAHERQPSKAKTKTPKHAGIRTHTRAQARRSFCLSQSSMLCGKSLESDKTTFRTQDKDPSLGTGGGGR